MKCLSCVMMLWAATGVVAQDDPSNSAAAAVERQSTSKPVPDVRGKTVRLAEQLLRVRDLKPLAGVFYIAAHNWRDDVRPGVVAMQTPQPGTRVPSASTVAVWTFAKAPEEHPVLKMPDLRGAERQQVAERLKELGLPLMTPRDDGKVEGSVPTRVADQYPRPDQPILKGTSVFVTWQTKE